MRNIVLTAVGGILLTAGPALAQQTETYTIHQIFERPGLTGYLPENVEWSPDGKYLTYLKHHEGSEFSDLYVVDAATGKQRVLVQGDILAANSLPTGSLKNEREKERMTRYGVASYHWAPRGDALLYANGDQLFLYNPKTRKTTQITHTPGDKGDPKLSPDERMVSYVTDGDLYYVPVEGGEVKAVQPHRDQILNGDMDWVYPEELELRTAYEWSPDSRSIAFMQFDESPVHPFPLVDYLPHLGSVTEEKYPKAGDPNPIVRLAVHSVETGKTVWMQVAGTPDTYLPRFGWLPDGKTLYAIVLNRAQTRETIYLCNPATGVSHELITVTDPYWIDVNDNLYFFKSGDKFLWGTLQDGWQHLYLFDMHGHLLRKLTSGNWNVQSLEGVDEKNGWVYFTAPAQSPIDTDLYRVSLNGGAPQRLTQGDGNHDIKMAPDEQHYLDSYSNALQPVSMVMNSVTGGQHWTIESPTDLSAYHLQKPEFFTILAGDGQTQLQAKLIRPAGFDPHKKYPVIMYQYGGPDEPAVVRNIWGGSFELFNQLLVRQGFVIFEVDNRAATYFSHIRQALIKYRLGKIELEDQLAGVKWLKAQPWVDSSRLGIWGWSYGGYMTTYELTHAPGVWKAAIAVAPVTNWTDYDTIYTERYLGMPQQNAKGYHDSSSVNFTEGMQDHLLLVHGTGDDNVHFQNSAQFIQAMIENGKQFQLMIYPNKTHGISGERARTHLFTLMDNYWKAQLKPTP